jgi:hypothetical protein
MLRASSESAARLCAMAPKHVDAAAIHRRFFPEARPSLDAAPLVQCSKQRSRHSSSDEMRSRALHLCKARKPQYFQ